MAEGESLSSIALGQYGDARLWFRIAQANALDVAPTAKLMAGQVLQVPAALAAGADAQGFRPYDPSAVIGDQSAALPAPAADNGGCWALGKIIMVVVAVVVAVKTGQLEAVKAFWSSAFGAAQTSAVVTAAAAATGAAAGSIASQVVGMGLGVQEGFSWKGVALAALSGGVGAGLGDWANLGTKAGTWQHAMVRAAVGNALTQTSAVVLGLQPKFDWRGVAASAVGAGVGYEVGGALGLRGDTTGLNPGVLLAKRLATGLLAGTAAAVARGGKVAIQQVATDAFGQALADGFMDAVREPVRTVVAGGGSSGSSGASGSSRTSSASPAGGWDDRNGSDVQSDAFMPAMAYDHENGLDVQSSRYTPPVRSDSARTINGLDLPEGYGLMGPAGDERLGERRLRTMGLEAPSQPSLAQRAAAATRVNQGLNEPQGPGAGASNWGSEGLRSPMPPVLSMQDLVSVSMARLPAEVYPSGQWGEFAQRAKVLGTTPRQPWTPDSLYMECSAKAAQQRAVEGQGTLSRETTNLAVQLLTTEGGAAGIGVAVAGVAGRGARQVGGGAVGNVEAGAATNSGTLNLRYPVATNPNEAFFWSGRTDGIGGEAVARKIAESQSGTTLEALIENRGIKMPKWDATDPAVVQAWKDISADYARGASGTVRAVIGQSLRPGNVWEAAELGALKANPHCIDPAVFAQVRLLRHKPQRGSSCPTPDEGAGGCKNRSNLRSHGRRVAQSRTGGDGRTGL